MVCRAQLCGMARRRPRSRRAAQPLPARRGRHRQGEDFRFVRRHPGQDKTVLR